MPCPYCSEEHPVTLDRCPLTGQPLQAPVEALPAAPARAPFWSLISEAARLYRKNFLVFAVTAAIAFLPLVAVWTLASNGWDDGSRRWHEAMQIALRANREHRALNPEEQARIREARGPVQQTRKSLLLGVGALLMLVPLMMGMQVLAHAALVPLVGDRALGGTMGPSRAWLAVGLQAGRVLWTATLGTAITLLGFVFCLAPGVLFAFGYALAMPVVLLERRSGADALGRSWQLMRREWPRVLGMWAVAVLAAVVLTAPLSVLFADLADPDAIFELWSSWRGTALQFGNFAVSALLFPLPVIGTTLVYLHARHEQDNIPLAELQLQMQRAATGDW